MKGRETEIPAEEDLQAFRPAMQEGVSLTQLIEQMSKIEAQGLELIKKICPPYKSPENDLLGR